MADPRLPRNVHSMLITALQGKDCSVILKNQFPKNFQRLLLCISNRKGICGNIVFLGDSENKVKVVNSVRGKKKKVGRVDP